MGLSPETGDGGFQLGPLVRLREVLARANDPFRQDRTLPLVL